jgi:hypothetical protein
MALLNIDVTGIEPDTGYETVPAGWYNVAADESDLKPTKDGAGTYLQIRFNILDGQYHGRKLFTRLNIRNSNAQAQEIALRQLSAIGHAVDILQIADSQQLHGIPLKVRVKIREAEGNYESSNELVAFKNINEVVATAGEAAAQPAFTPPPVAAFTPPTAAATFVPPAVAAAPVAAAPVAAAQPWAAPPLAAAPPPAQDPANPFATAPVAAAVASIAAATPWVPPVAEPQPVAAAVAAAPVAVDPAVAAAAAAAQTAPPPWANQVPAAQ